MENLSTVCNNLHKDEIGCTVYEKDVSYVKSMPPEPLSGNSTEVQLDLEVLAILDISEVDSYISIQQNVHLTW